MGEIKRPSLIVSLLVSIGAHVLISLLLIFVDNNYGREKTKTSIEVEIVKIDDFEKEQELLKQLEKMQIVEQNQINNELDKNAKYLSAHNQKVLKETVAKKHGEFQNIKNQVPVSPSVPQKPVSQSQESSPIHKFIPRRDLFDGYQASVKRNENSKNMKNPNERNGAESQSRDYLPDTSAGMETMLSTREFVYYTYYNRIRNQLSQHWESRVREKFIALMKKGRRISNESDKITKLLVVLDKNGTLVKIQVVGESGITDLDDVAIEAFRLAAPFPHPPKGIIDVDGTIKIPWDFIIET